MSARSLSSSSSTAFTVYKQKLNIGLKRKRSTGTNAMQRLLSGQKERYLGFKVEKVTAVVPCLLSNIKDRRIRKTGLTTLISLE